MPLQAVYLISAKNLGPFLDALRRAQAPAKVTIKFIEELGFTSTNDRLFLPLLRAARFIDETGKPTARYHEFLDDTEWKRVLAAGVRDMYPDLFRVNKTAHLLAREQVTGKIKSLSEGTLSETVLTNTVKTFLELVKLADFTEGPSEADSAKDHPSERPEPNLPPQHTARAVEQRSGHASGPSLVYRIEVVLPAVRDQAVYDAIFRSIREHLLQ